MKKSYSQREWILVGAMMLFALTLGFLPTGFEQEIYVNAVGSKARVVSVDNSDLYRVGVVAMGEQVCRVQLLGGPHKQKQIDAVNFLGGKLEFDTIYTEGDTVWVLVEQDSKGDMLFANMVSHYRFGKEVILFLVFCLLLILFLGTTGLRTILSFVLAFLLIWKILIPFALRGYEPMLLALLVGTVLSVSCLLLVAGLTKKALAAILGTLVCSVLTALMAYAGSHYLSINGAVMNWSESLLFAGYSRVNLTKLFQGAIYLSCLGALLDLAVDISSALQEVVDHHPTISRTALIQSGMNIAQSVVGSQTTTLLLAYIGSYLTVMMVYMAQGTPIMSILNSPSVAAEILHTLVGCIALVLVAPITTLCSAFLFIPKGKEHDQTLNLLQRKSG
jgi:uncharacterized membrane protein